MKKTSSLSQYRLPNQKISRTLGVLPNESLQKRGEMHLANGDLSGLHYFEEALSLDPENPKLLCDQALALFEFGTQEQSSKVLGLACRRFHEATNLQPDYFRAWYGWALALCFLGEKTGKESYLVKSKAKFEKALCYLPNEETEAFLADMSLLLFSCAKHSEEIGDFKTSLVTFEKASKNDATQNAKFWITYGDNAGALGRYQSDPSMFVRAASCYKKALSETIASSEGWFSLATALFELANHTHDEYHYTQSAECFATASNLDPKNVSILYEWAELLYSGGLWLNDTKRLRSCIEKCKQASRLKRRAPHIRALLCKALALHGLKTNNLELMRAAETKIDTLLERSESSNILWEAYGSVLLCLADYFNDLDSYYDAIDKFQHALSLDRSSYQSWFGLAMANQRASRIEENPKISLRAVRFFRKALDLHISPVTHFHYGNALALHDEEKNVLSSAISHMERALLLQPGAAYTHPDWMFRYGITLDALGSYYEEENYYLKAIEALTQVLHIAPDYNDIHYHLGLAYAHYGDLMVDQELVNTSLHHFRLAYSQEKESDHVLLDWAITLITFGELFPESPESDYVFAEAEYKLSQTAKLGNTHAYYTLACLFTIKRQYERAIVFLEKSHALGALPTIDEMEQDEWLEDLRSKECYKEFLTQVF